MQTMKKDKKIILFADDNKNIRKSLETLAPVLFPDYNFEFFIDGISLKKRLERNIKNICAVVTDDEMPEINGSEIIKEYAKKPEFKKIPFILSYHGERSIGEEAIKNGAIKYFLKPYPFSHLNLILLAI